MSTSDTDIRERTGLSFAEFVAIIASLMALNALAVDVMLPALPDIAAEYGIADQNEAQLVLTAYLITFGLSQLIYGPLADRFGRKIVLSGGLLIYAIAGIFSVIAPSFEALLAARLLQGLGAGAPRVLAMAIVRDCFEGRQMARVMSMTIMVFILVPVIAPSIGQLMILGGHWRWIFGMLTICAMLVTAWMWIRLPETLMEENRSSLSIGSVARNYGIILTTRTTLGYMIACALMFGGMFGFLNSAQQIFVDIYETGTAFPLLFASIAATIAVASLINSRLVIRIGMRVLAHYALVAMTLVYAVHAAIAYAGVDTLYSFIALMAAGMFCFGLLLANLNALAMVPVGHIAGSAAAMIGFVGTTGGAVLGYFVGQAFDGTTFPFTAAFTVLGFTAIVVVMITEKGRMFRPSEGPGH